ncbi:MAG: hypothetical protein QGI79_07725, partial [Dehalococcoidia bacterium]|nr:hypothetical protein [Dehalococcoidia bacterium]
SGLLVIGMFLVFYFPHRQIWARCRHSDDGDTEIVLRTVSSRSYAITSEMEALAKDLRKSLGHRTEV